MNALIDTLFGRAELIIINPPPEAMSLLQGDTVGVQVLPDQSSLMCIDGWPQADGGYHDLQVAGLAGLDQLRLQLTQPLVSALISNGTQSAFLKLCLPGGKEYTGDLTVNCDLTDSAVTGFSPAAPTAAAGSEGAATPDIAAGLAAAASQAGAGAASPAPAAQPLPEGSKKHPIWFTLLSILGLVLALLLLGAVAWFLFLREPAATGSNVTAEPEAAAQTAPAYEAGAEEAVGRTVEPPVSSTAAACELNNSASDAQMLSDCLKSKPDDSTLLKFADSVAAADRCDLSARLLISQSRARGGQVALHYARYLDPDSKQGSACFKKSKADAIYWYQKVLETDAANQEAAAALQRLGAATPAAADPEGKAKSGALGNLVGVSK